MCTSLCGSRVESGPDRVRAGRPHLAGCDPVLVRGPVRNRIVESLVALPVPLEKDVARSAAPAAVELALARLASQRPAALEQISADPGLARAFTAVAGASRSLTRLLLVDPG